VCVHLIYGRGEDPEQVVAQVKELLADKIGEEAINAFHADQLIVQTPRMQRKDKAIFSPAGRLTVCDETVRRVGLRVQVVLPWPGE
jgi:hypothetical protein